MVLQRIFTPPKNEAIPAMNLTRMTKHLQEIYDDASIMDFGKAHRIVINRFAAARKPAAMPYSAISKQPAVLP